MSQKYEKPLIIPFKTEKGETGFGVSCVGGGDYKAVNCAPTGGTAGIRCNSGVSAGASGCTGGTTPGLS